MKLIILFSSRWAAKPIDAEQPKNHPRPADLGLVVWGPAFGGLQQFIF